MPYEAKDLDGSAMRKRIMVIGPSGSGKTTLCNAINGVEGRLRKTQDMIYGKYTVDVPGSYLEIPWMYKHLIAAAQNSASQVVILVDSTAKRDFYAPGFAEVFTVPITGVVTKCSEDDEKARKCEEQLKRIGVKPPWFYIDKEETVGIEKLKKYLLCLPLDGEKE